MKLHPKKIEAVLALSGRERYEYFVKAVADWQHVWGLFDDGWALAQTDEGEAVFPLWPDEAYAHLCAKDAWAKFEPKQISLESLTHVLLPKLKLDGVLPGVFPTPFEKGVTSSVDELEAALIAELKKY